MTRVSIALAAALLCAAIARAQEVPGNRNWDLSIWIAGATGQLDRSSLVQGQVWSTGFFLGRVIAGPAGPGWLRGNLEYGFTIVPALVASRPNLTYGAGFEPVVVRWNFRRLQRFVPYVELAGGGLFTTRNFPRGDTSYFNFTARGGGGVNILLKRSQALDFGLRFLHISNANLGNDNPEFNGVEVRVGYHWRK
ncbi:MAG TPA: acyloxyacyl hydrolase [Terriglobales bacterium]